MEVMKPWTNSYKTTRRHQPHWTYESLLSNILICKKKTVDFLFEKKVLKKERMCKICSSPMTLSKCASKTYIEEVGFRCRTTGKQDLNRHDVWDSVKVNSMIRVMLNR
jgi:hypothetical protein